jgi:valyl-tRNA synthetase
LNSLKTKVLPQPAALLAATQPIAQLPASSQPQMVAGVVGTTQVLIPLAGVVDIVALKSKLQKDFSKVEAEVAALSQRLNNPNFVDKAPKEVVQGARNALAEAQKQAEILSDRLAQL